jgi:hypothetical protein
VSAEFPITLATKTNQYALTSLLAKGSIADIYECGENIVKVARHAGDNELLDNEARILRELYPSTQPEVEYFRHLPKLRDSFSLRGKIGSPRRVNVIAGAGGMLRGSFGERTQGSSWHSFERANLARQEDDRSMTSRESELVEALRELRLMAFEINCQRRFIGEIPWPSDTIVDGLLTCAAVLPEERMMQA